MESKTLITGIAIGGAIGVAAKALFDFCKLRPMTAEELAQVKFNPKTMNFTHPFYQTWAGVEENLESLSSICVKCHKAARDTVMQAPLEKMSERDQNLVKIACIREFISGVLQRYPDEFETGTDIEFDVDRDPSTGEIIVFDPYENANQDSLTQQELADQKAIIQSIAKNRQAIAKAKREVAKELMHQMLYEPKCAEVVAKLVSGNSLNVCDLTDEEVKGMWDAIDLVLHYLFIGKANNVMKTVTTPFIATLKTA